MKLIQVQQDSPRFFKCSDLLKLNCNSNANECFDKKFVLAFNSFLKIQLNYDKENNDIFKSMPFSEGDVVYLTFVLLIYSLTKCVLEDGFKDSCVLKNL